MTASALSPASSPRLPSPPPMAEDQLGPKSPIATPEEQQKLFTTLDHGAARRIRPGTRAEDMAEGPPLVDISEIESAFQLMEHLKALHYSLTHPDGAHGTVAVDQEMAHRLAQPPDNVDKTLWLYELCRFLIQKVNSIIVALFQDNPPCSSNTCPEMRASEWQYLCAVHDPPKSCCAIDYCCHTLDWAANLLTSPKTFPSRISTGNEQSTQQQQIRHLTNIFRRVYRIFAHAWFQHREMFWKVEGRSGLYVLFKTVCDVYGLIPEDNYTIPSEAEGIEEPQQAAPPMILKREPSGPAPTEENSSIMEGVTDHTLSTAGTTKRHRHSPSVGATAVSTVVEESEEEEEQPAKEEVPVPEISVESPDEPSPAGEYLAPPEEPTIGEDADPAEATTITAPAEESPAPTEDEKQSASEADQEDPPPQHAEKGSSAAEAETSGDEIEEPKPEQPAEIESKEEEVEEVSLEEPEKTEKDETTVDSVISGEDKDPGEKPGSNE
ncbi:Mob1/phocein [Lophiostoma macrostomum CBS 122681]|uniref:Mob1/phocein n=1 Tax=Lophiostoma macrostomum CBS 122681 TaxID=1314788 RepID=A0A6A6TT74_9PLEO|nr:Mob1/phocein [Lophiostoma macrostomum CBS 122681]